MFCILLANLRKRVKIPYNLLSVNEYFSGKRNNKRAFLVSLFDIALMFYQILTLNLLSCILLVVVLSLELLLLNVAR